MTLARQFTVAPVEATPKPKAAKPKAPKAAKAKPVDKTVSALKPEFARQLRKLTF